jgi:hypothetical protein
MTKNLPAIKDIRQHEREIGLKLRKALAPYRVLGDGLVEVISEIVEGLREREPGAEHAVALIAARLATEALAVHNLIGLGYPVQAFTIVGSMLELMHTAAYIGGNNERAREYFEHANRAKAYPGNVKRTIEAVGRELNIPKDAVNREYEDFYNQMCLVKHGNPMAMSLGAIVDEEGINVVIGPLLTKETVRVAFASAQHAVRYLLLVVNIFVRYHCSDEAGREFYDRLETISGEWYKLNKVASESLATFEGNSV